MGRDLKNSNSENNDPVQGSLSRKLLFPLRVGSGLSSGFLHPERLPLYFVFQLCLSALFLEPLGVLTPFHPPQFKNDLSSVTISTHPDTPLRIWMCGKGDPDSPADPGLTHQLASKGAQRKNTPANTCELKPGQPFDTALIRFVSPCGSAALYALGSGVENRENGMKPSCGKGLKPSHICAQL